MFTRTFSLTGSLSSISGSSSADTVNISKPSSSSPPVSSGDALYEQLSAIRKSLWQVDSLDEDTVKAALERLVAMESSIESDEHLRNKNSWLQKIWVLRSACLLKEESLADDFSSERCEDARNLLKKALALKGTGSDALMRFKEPLKALSRHMDTIAFLDSIQVTHMEQAARASRERIKRFTIKTEAAIQEGRLSEAEQYAIHSRRVRVPELPLRMSAGLTLFAQKDCFQTAYAFLDGELPKIADGLLCLALSKDRHSEARRVASPR
ncbi:hypothetical protein Lgee_0261 [Legionella geestiana]|uniref:Uncharacterized protein n=2 Tax=Legionella geestiana TaxID=45065 RepID=A0A0W0U9B9_9GAMM|nr:hypothetical protein Lgee_0261 [Legionella geestiana]STX53664.1 Uncharacterised protein [Legionella geestiana]